MPTAPAASGAPRLLLHVEDDDAIRALVRMELTEEGFTVLGASTFEEATRILDTEDIRVALVDLRLGDRSGMDIVKRLAGSRTTGCIIISGKAEVLDRVIGIEVGADDYITKPFEIRELTARVKRCAARVEALRSSVQASGEPPERVVLGDWTVDTERHAVLGRDNVPAALGEAEFRTLVCLLRRRGKVLTRDEIYAFVVGPGERDPLDRRIDVFVSSLRRKLSLEGPTGIRTVHRVGYIID